jgi:hypothetical protein
MRNGLVTPFWQKAAASLRMPYRARYLGYFERAERWDLATDGLIELLSRAKSRIAKTLHTPGRPHSA